MATTGASSVGYLASSSAYAVGDGDDGGGHTSHEGDRTDETGWITALGLLLLRWLLYAVVAWVSVGVYRRLASHLQPAFADPEFKRRPQSERPRVAERVQAGDRHLSSADTAATAAAAAAATAPAAVPAGEHRGRGDNAPFSITAKPAAAAAAANATTAVLTGTTDEYENGDEENNAAAAITGGVDFQLTSKPVCQTLDIRTSVRRSPLATAKAGAPTADDSRSDDDGRRHDNATTTMAFGPSVYHGLPAERDYDAERTLVAPGVAAVANAAAEHVVSKQILTAATSRLPAAAAGVEVHSDRGRSGRSVETAGSNGDGGGGKSCIGSPRTVSFAEEVAPVGGGVRLPQEADRCRSRIDVVNNDDGDDDDLLPPACDPLCDASKRFHVTRCSFSVDKVINSEVPMKILTPEDVCPPGTLVVAPHPLGSGHDDDERHKRDRYNDGDNYEATVTLAAADRKGLADALAAAAAATVAVGQRNACGKFDCGSFANEILDPEKICGYGGDSDAGGSSDQTTKKSSLGAVDGTRSNAGEDEAIDVARPAASSAGNRSSTIATLSTTSTSTPIITSTVTSHNYCLSMMITTPSGHCLDYYKKSHRSVVGVLPASAVSNSDTVCIQRSASHMSSDAINVSISNTATTLANSDATQDKIRDKLTHNHSTATGSARCQAATVNGKDQNNTNHSQFSRSITVTHDDNDTHSRRSSNDVSSGSTGSTSRPIIQEARISAGHDYVERTDAERVFEVITPVSVIIADDRGGHSNSHSGLWQQPPPSLFDGSDAISAITTKLMGSSDSDGSNLAELAFTTTTMTPMATTTTPTTAAAACTTTTKNKMAETAAIAAETSVCSTALDSGGRQRCNVDRGATSMTSRSSSSSRSNVGGDSRCESVNYIYGNRDCGAARGGTSRERTTDSNGRSGGENSDNNYSKLPGQLTVAVATAMVDAGHVARISSGNAVDDDDDDDKDGVASNSCAETSPGGLDNARNGSRETLPRVSRVPIAESSLTTNTSFRSNIISSSGNSGSGSSVGNKVQRKPATTAASSSNNNNNYNTHQNSCYVMSTAAAAETAGGLVFSVDLDVSAVVDDEPATPLSSPSSAPARSKGIAEAFHKDLTLAGFDAFHRGADNKASIDVDANSAAAADAATVAVAGRALSPVAVIAAGEDGGHLHRCSQLDHGDRAHCSTTERVASALDAISVPIAAVNALAVATTPAVVSKGGSLRANGNSGDASGKEDTVDQLVVFDNARRLRQQQEPWWLWWEAGRRNLLTVASSGSSGRSSSRTTDASQAWLPNAAGSPSVDRIAGGRRCGARSLWRKTSSPSSSSEKLDQRSTDAEEAASSHSRQRLTENDEKAAMRQEGVYGSRCVRRGYRRSGRRCRSHSPERRPATATKAATNTVVTAETFSAASAAPPCGSVAMRNDKSDAADAAAVAASGAQASATTTTTCTRPRPPPRQRNRQRQRRRSRSVSPRTAASMRELHGVANSFATYVAASVAVDASEDQILQQKSLCGRWKYAPGKEESTAAEGLSYSRHPLEPPFDVVAWPGDAELQRRGRPCTAATLTQVQPPSAPLPLLQYGQTAAATAADVADRGGVGSCRDEAEGAPALGKAAAAPAAAADAVAVTAAVVVGDAKPQRTQVTAATAAALLASLAADASSATAAATTAFHMASVSGGSDGVASAAVADVRSGPDAGLTRRPPRPRSPRAPWPRLEPCRACDRNDAGHSGSGSADCCRYYRNQHRLYFCCRYHHRQLGQQRRRERQCGAVARLPGLRPAFQVHSGCRLPSSTSSPSLFCGGTGRSERKRGARVRSAWRARLLASACAHDRSACRCHVGRRRRRRSRFRDPIERRSFIEVADQPKSTGQSDPEASGLLECEASSWLASTRGGGGGVMPNAAVSSCGLAVRVNGGWWTCATGRPNTAFLERQPTAADPMGAVISCLSSSCSKVVYGRETTTNSTTTSLTSLCSASRERSNQSKRTGDSLAGVQRGEYYECDASGAVNGHARLSINDVSVAAGLPLAATTNGNKHDYNSKNDHLSRGCPQSECHDAQFQFWQQQQQQQQQLSPVPSKTTGNLLPKKSRKPLIKSVRWNLPPSTPLSVHCVLDGDNCSNYHNSSNESDNQGNCWPLNGGATIDAGCDQRTNGDTRHHHFRHSVAVVAGLSAAAPGGAPADITGEPVALDDQTRNEHILTDDSNFKANTDTLPATVAARPTEPASASRSGRPLMQAAGGGHPLQTDAGVRASDAVDGTSDDAITGDLTRRRAAERCFRPAFAKAAVTSQPTVPPPPPPPSKRNTASSPCDDGALQPLLPMSPTGSTYPILRTVEMAGGDYELVYREQLERLTVTAASATSDADGKGSDGSPANEPNRLVARETIPGFNRENSRAALCWQWFTDSPLSTHDDGYYYYYYYHCPEPRCSLCEPRVVPLFPRGNSSPVSGDSRDGSSRSHSGNVVSMTPSDGDNKGDNSARLFEATRRACLPPSGDSDGNGRNRLGDNESRPGGSDRRVACRATGANQSNSERAPSKTLPRRDDRSPIYAAAAAAVTADNDLSLNGEVRAAYSIAACGERPEQAAPSKKALSCDTVHVGLTSPKATAVESHRCDQAIIKSRTRSTGADGALAAPCTNAAARSAPGVSTTTEPNISGNVSAAGGVPATTFAASATMGQTAVGTSGIKWWWRHRRRQPEGCGTTAVLNEEEFADLLPPLSPDPGYDSFSDAGGRQLSSPESDGSPAELRGGVSRCRDDQPAAARRRGQPPPLSPTPLLASVRRFPPRSDVDNASHAVAALNGGNGDGGGGGGVNSIVGTDIGMMEAMPRVGLLSLLPHIQEINGVQETCSDGGPLLQSSEAAGGQVRLQLRPGNDTVALNNRDTVGYGGHHLPPHQYQVPGWRERAGLKQDAGYVQRRCGQRRSVQYGHVQPAAGGVRPTIGTAATSGRHNGNEVAATVNTLSSAFCKGRTENDENAQVDSSESVSLGDRVGLGDAAVIVGYSAPPFLEAIAEEEDGDVTEHGRDDDSNADDEEIDSGVDASATSLARGDGNSGGAGGSAGGGGGKTVSRQRQRRAVRNAINASAASTTNADGKGDHDDNNDDGDGDDDENAQANAHAVYTWTSAAVLKAGIDAADDVVDGTRRRRALSAPRKVWPMSGVAMASLSSSPSSSPSSSVASKTSTSQVAVADPAATGTGPVGSGPRPYRPPKPKRRRNVDVPNSTAIAGTAHATVAAAAAAAAATAATAACTCNDGNANGTARCSEGHTCRSLKSSSQTTQSRSDASAGGVQESGHLPPPPDHLTTPLQPLTGETSSEGCRTRSKATSGGAGSGEDDPHCVVMVRL